MPVENWVLPPEPLNEGAMLCMTAKFAKKVTWKPCLPGLCVATQSYTKDRPASAGLIIHNVDRTDEGNLFALYRSAKSETLEQRDVDCERPERAINNMRNIGRGYSGAWLLARLDGAAVGYALANLAHDAEFPVRSAWLVDIGCKPERRRKGIASALLGEITKHLRLVGTAGS